jgi:hypothetical protein
MSDEYGHWQHGVVAAAIAPAKDVDAVAGDLSKCRRERSIVAHPSG